MTLEWEGAEVDRQAATAAETARLLLLSRVIGEPLVVANEFSEMKVTHVETRNGARILIEAPRSGQWIALDPIELEALTWQTTRTFSEMIARPFEPMFPESGK